MLKQLIINKKYKMEDQNQSSDVIENIQME